MAQQQQQSPAPLLRAGKSWSAGSSSPIGSLSSPAKRRVKSERLRKLEQDVRASAHEMKIMEAEIERVATTLGKLKKFDARRMEKLRELVDDDAAAAVAASGDGDGDGKRKVPASEDLDALHGEVVNGKEPKGGEEEWGAQGEVSSEGEVVNEEVESLRSEHDAAQGHIQFTRASLEKKRAELEVLAEKHQTIAEQMAREEKLVQAADADESLQEGVLVHPEMRSLSEDLGRLGRLMEGLKEANSAADALKPGLTRPQLKGRVYHPVTQLRSRNRNSPHSWRPRLRVGSADLGRSVSLGDQPLVARRSSEPPMSKEPAEFEEREGGGNRKRHKNSSFELERLQEEQAKLEMEAKEKKRLLESLVSFSSQLPGSPGDEPARGSSASSRDIVSPMSVFEGFGETPSYGFIGPPSSGSAGLMSDSSESSSEFSTERPDPGAFSSAAKRLDFESFGKGHASFPVDMAGRGTFEDGFSWNGSGHDGEISPAKSGEQPEVVETGFEGSSLEQGDEYTPSENGKDFRVPATNSFFDTVGPEVFSPVSGTEEIPGLEVEVSSPTRGAEDMQELSAIEMVEIQQHEAFSPEIRTSGERKSEVLDPESGPEQVQDPDEIVAANFEQEVLEIFSENSRTAAREADAEGTVEETENHSHQGGAAKDEVEEIDIPTEEFDSLRDGEEDEGEEEDSTEEEVTSTRNRVEEIDVPEEDIKDFEEAEVPDETGGPQILSSEIGRGSKSDVSADDDGEDEAVQEEQPLPAQSPELQRNGLKSAEPEPWGPPEAGQRKAEEFSDERQSRRLEAENQMLQLSSQLSLLQKQVEEEVELHEKSKNVPLVEHTSSEKEQLSRQVSFFSDEVRGLRQNIDEIQRILHKEGGDFSSVEHWAKDLHSKCADQAAQLEHLGRQVSMLSKYLEHHLQLRVDIDDKLGKETRERQKVEAQLTDLSKAFAITVSTMERDEEAVGELIEHQKHLLVDQLNEAEKLRNIAELRVLTLNNQIQQLEMVCDAARNIQTVTKYQDKAFKYGLQALVQLFLLALGMITLYRRVAEPCRVSLVPT